MTLVQALKAAYRSPVGRGRSPQMWSAAAPSWDLYADFVDERGSVVPSLAGPVAIPGLSLVGVGHQ
jgi:hypothetical protein